MKKIFRILMFVLLLFLVGCGGKKMLETRMINGEKVVFEVGSRKPYSGDYNITKYNNNGSTYTQQEGEYKKGKLNGLNKWYYENGVIWKEAYMKNGILSGKYKEYNRAGKILVEGKYTSGRQDGIFKKYNNGNFLYEEHHTLGKSEYIKKAYYKNGNLKYESVNEITINGSEEYLKEYYESGKLKLEITYKRGEPRGPFKEYDESGQIIREGNFQ